MNFQKNKNLYFLLNDCGSIFVFVFNDENSKRFLIDFGELNIESNEYSYFYERKKSNQKHSQYYKPVFAAFENKILRFTTDENKIISTLNEFKFEK